MRFVVDESTGPLVADWLTNLGFEVLSVYDVMPGIRDSEILKIAFELKAITITNDKDFGEMVFKDQLKHHGIVLLRLESERSHHKIDILKNLILL